MALAPSDKAVAQAFREMLPVGVRYPSIDAESLIRRARELDAEKGGEFPDSRIGLETIAALHARATPPTQPGDAVEAVARAIWESGGYSIRWDGLFEPGKENCRDMARAAIAAMQAGEDNK